MVAAVAAAAALACTPHAGLGSVTFVRGATQHVLDLETCQERTRPAAHPQATVTWGPLVSPNGRLRATAPVAAGKESIRAGGKILRSWPQWSPNAKNGSPGPIMLLGWSGDSRWVFYAIDPMGSQSIIADGVQMRAVSLTGADRPVASMLANDDYRAWCGGRLVLTAGGDRIAWHNKRLVTSAPPPWRTRALVSAPGRAWGSLTCTPGGHAIVVQSEADRGTGMSSVWAHWALWQVSLDGLEYRLTSPPAGYSDDSPRFSPDGSTLFFVRSRKDVGTLYALHGGRLLGPLASLGFDLGYYGHHAWTYSVTP